VTRVQGFIRMVVDGDGEVFLPSTHWSTNHTDFMTFASQADRAWANEQHVNGSPSYNTKVWSKVHDCHFKIDRRKGEYSFSFGYKKHANPNDWRTVNNDKADWAQVIGCNTIVVER